MKSAAKVWAVLAGTGALLGTGMPAVAQFDAKRFRDRQGPVLGPLKRGSGGVTDDTFASRNVILNAWMPLNQFPQMPATGANGADCSGYVSPSGREYALMGLSWGNAFVEVTDPDNPVLVAFIPGGVTSLWRDIEVVGTYVYAVSEGGNGIQVMDIASIDAGQVEFLGNIMQGGHSRTHTMLSNADSGYLYLCGGNADGGGMIPCSTASPVNPVFEGPGWNMEYVHEAQIVTYTEGPYAGKEIAFLYSGGLFATNGIAIVDVTNKASPIQLSHIWYPGLSFSHQGWLSDDRKYLYHDDETDAPSSGGPNVPRDTTRVFDVSDLSNPRLCASFTTGLPSVDHNQYVSGRYLYQSNYTTGLRVWDLSEPLRPVEVAWIDTKPEDDGTGYHGAWGNYPFFPSGTLLISDIERGLFVVKMSVLEVDPAGPLPSALMPSQAAPLEVHVSARNATIDANSVKLWVSVNGEPYAATPMTPGAGGNFSGAIPAGSCQDRVRYYFSAATDEATPREFTYPLRGQAEPLKARVQSDEVVIFADDFETDKGWTVVNDLPIGITGIWVRVFRSRPVGTAPIGDADGSGRAFVTGNLPNESVSGRPTRLISPVLDLAGSPDAVISYSRWLMSIVSPTDPLLVEVSNNNGSTWTQVESLGPSSGGWQPLAFRVADFLTPTAQVKVRFSISNFAPSTSVTEAGVDAFRVVSPQCTAPCYPDCNSDTVLNLADFGCFQTKFALADPYADCNGDSVRNLADFGCFTTKFALGCP